MKTPTPKTTAAKKPSHRTGQRLTIPVNFSNIATTKKFNS